jgi:hypothetical protein
MILQLGGMYVNHYILYFPLLLQNKSNMRYDIDNISFTIKHKQKSKRTATQELSLAPVYSLNGLNNVKTNYIGNRTREFYSNTIEACYFDKNPTRAFYFMEKSVLFY